MICKFEKIKGIWKGCDGAGTIWKNDKLIDCPRCGGSGELIKSKKIPTYLKPKE